MPKKIASQPVAPEHRHNFKMFAMDNLGVGVINGSIISFLAVYATRIGASSLQVGLINAVPALISLLIALPAGVWLSRQPLKRAVIGSALLFRVQYLLLALIPFIPGDLNQIYSIVAAIFLTAVPGTVLTISFNAFFADTVPMSYRAYVASNRMAAFSVATVSSTLISGLILNALPMPLGYQVVFLIGFLGAVASTYALWQIKHGEQIGEMAANYGNITPPVDVADEDLHHPGNRVDLLHLDILKGNFKKYLGLMYVFHLFVFIPAPIFPLYMVRNLYLPDLVISIGYAAYYIAVLFATRYITTMTSRHGTKATMGTGAVVNAAYPFLLITGFGAGSLIAASITGGIAWAFAGGLMYNYILEKMPDGDKSAHLAWYNITYNLALLTASLSGGIIGDTLGLFTALVIFGAGRALSGFLILRWG